MKGKERVLWVLPSAISIRYHVFQRRKAIPGYAHYWRRAPELNWNNFNLAYQDIQKIMHAAMEQGFKLAGPTGTGPVQISNACIAFNGSKECRHPYRNLGDPWPSITAHGVETEEDPVVGPFFNGALLSARSCGGNCSEENFVVDQIFLPQKWHQLEEGGYFCRCRTLYKPYDIIVTACLVRLKERLGDEIQISSDGFERGFEDAKRFCRELFGWTETFEFEPYDSLRV